MVGTDLDQQQHGLRQVEIDRRALRATDPFGRSATVRTCRVRQQKGHFTDGTRGTVGKRVGIDHARNAQG